MIEVIATASMEVALLAAFTFILGALSLILWDQLRGRMRGWPRVMAMVVGAPACALAVTVIWAGVGGAVAVTLEPEEPLPAHIGQRAPEAETRERTSPAEGRGAGTTTERSASPTATATASPAATASPSP